MKKSALFLVAYIILLSHSSIAQQDLFNEENTRKFAEYLLESGQYPFAVKEYERLTYLSPGNEKDELNLMKSYRLSGFNVAGVERTYQLFEPINEIPREHGIEFSKMLMNEKKWEQARQFWGESQKLPELDRSLLSATVFIFQSDFTEAQRRLETYSDSTNYLLTGYKSIIDRGIHGPRKSPFLAGFMSTAIPGLGKAYTGDWKDGIVSLIFTGGMAFQAYRKFNQFGVKDARPWIYTAIGGGFYLGNIYGSVKSAKNKNRKRINLLQHEASDLFNSYY